MYLQGEQRHRASSTSCDLCEVRLEISVAHRFHHLDRDDLVELAGDLAVVLQAHLDAVRSGPRARCARCAYSYCSLRNGDGRDPAAVILRRILAMPPQPLPISRT